MGGGLSYVLVLVIVVLNSILFGMSQTWPFLKWLTNHPPMVCELCNLSGQSQAQGPWSELSGEKIPCFSSLVLGVTVVATQILYVLFVSPQHLKKADKDGMRMVPTGGSAQWSQPAAWRRFVSVNWGLGTRTRDVDFGCDFDHWTTLRILFFWQNCTISWFLRCLSANFVIFLVCLGVSRWPRLPA